MRIGIILASIFMDPKYGKGRIFAPGPLALKLADDLVDKGHNVRFYSSEKIETKAEIVGGDEKLLTDDIVYFLFRNRGEEEKKYTTMEIKKRDFEYALTLKAYTDAKEGKLDIIHSYHDFGAHYFNELTQFPTVYTLHDPIPKEGDHTVEYYRYKRFHHHNYVSISDNQRIGIDMNFVGTVYHGIELDEFEYGEGGGDYMIFLGRMLEDKGPHIAIEASRITQIPLHIATSFTNANMAEEFFRSKIQPFVDNKLICEAGFLEGKAKSDFIKNALAFIFPLQWEEPFGMVTIEAMACGTPVVGYARGSLPELITDGENGFLVNSDEGHIRGDYIIKKTGVLGLVEALNRLKTMPREEYLNMSKKCREKVIDNFTVGKTTDNYLEVYKKIIGEKL